MKTIDKLRKFVEGGKVRKYSGGGESEKSAYQIAYERAIKAGSTPEQAASFARQQARQSDGMSISSNVMGSLFGQSAADAVGGAGTAFSRIESGEFGDGSKESVRNLKATAIGSAIFSEGVKLVDDLAMGDKNFGAQSQAIDDATHAISGSLMKSGNPYAMAAGAVLEGVNFLSKAGGQTVQGFDVDINSSGYGDMGHMESSSSRTIPFLGGLTDAGKIQRKLAKRNQQAQMAMSAANIANEQKFEQEARMNSIQNTIMNNQIALAGGLDTSLLGG